MKANNSKSYGFDVRDLIIAALVLAVGVLYWMSYETGTGQMTTDVNTARHIMQLQQNVIKLKGCVESGTRPCIISDLN